MYTASVCLFVCLSVCPFEEYVLSEKVALVFSFHAQWFVLTLALLVCLMTRFHVGYVTSFFP